MTPLGIEPATFRLIAQCEMDSTVLLSKTYLTINCVTLRYNIYPQLSNTYIFLGAFA